MNIYFLVEGKRTEMKVYPKWLSYLVPELQKVQWHYQVVKNNYCMFTGDGFPSLLYTQLKNSIEDVNTSDCFDYFVICLDADEQDIEACKQEILDFMVKENIRLNAKTEFEIIVQNKCLETWFLANPKIFKQNPNSSFLRECVQFYNVKKYDPELMGKLPDFEASTSVFHSSYLQELLAERNVTYSKKNPQSVIEEYFLRELIVRNQKTNHIQSFRHFVQFCELIRAKITQ